jgi:catechol 2,3-dioxygenase-like lactoylglutathione lyase family enzyme
MSSAAPPVSCLMTLRDSTVATPLPVQDLGRARAFYAEQLGLEPIDERPDGLLYRVSSGDFALFLSTGRAPGEHTQWGSKSKIWKQRSPSSRPAASRSRTTTRPASTRGGIADIEATTPARAPVASAAPGFVTARTTCSDRTTRLLTRPRPLVVQRSRPAASPIRCRLSNPACVLILSRPDPHRLRLWARRRRDVHCRLWHR